MILIKKRISLNKSLLEIAINKLIIIIKPHTINPGTNHKVSSRLVLFVMAILKITNNIVNKILITCRKYNFIGDSPLENASLVKKPYIYHIIYYHLVNN